MSLKENLSHIYNSIPENVKIVAVSKTHTIAEIMEAYQAGHRIFGENRAQEILSKYPLLPGDIEWHFIGHLQSNKVKHIIAFTACIESVDSFSLLKEINKQAQINNRIINCLLQFHIASESSKFGLDFDEAVEMLQSEDFLKMQNIKITGVMGMATFTDDVALIRKEFRNLRNIFLKLKSDYFRHQEEFKEISMGMSGDYQIAISEGSTMVRIGTAIFGERNIN